MGVLINKGFKLLKEYFIVQISYKGKILLESERFENHKEAEEWTRSINFSTAKCSVNIIYCEASQNGYDVIGRKTILQ